MRFFIPSWPVHALVAISKDKTGRFNRNSCISIVSIQKKNYKTFLPSADNGKRGKSTI